MKSFKNTYLNEDAMFSPTQKWMEEKFDFFNKEYFKGLLPPCKLVACTDLNVVGRNTFGKFKTDGWRYFKNKSSNGKYRMYNFVNGVL